MLHLQTLRHGGHVAPLPEISYFGAKLRFELRHIEP